MIKIKENQILLNDIIYDTGNIYSYERKLTKVVVKSIKFEDDDRYIVINDNYYLYKDTEKNYYYNMQLYFSEKKANNVVNNSIEINKKRKEKYEKEKEIKEKYEKQIIDEKLEEKYIDKPIMIFRSNEWIKTKGKMVLATNKGIYIIPVADGHICKLSREGKTWKMWSELEELEEEKNKLEKRIKELKGENK